MALRYISVKKRAADLSGPSFLLLLESAPLRNKTAKASASAWEFFPDSISIVCHTSAIKPSAAREAAQFRWGGRGAISSGINYARVGSLAATSSVVPTICRCFRVEHMELKNTIRTVAEDEALILLQSNTSIKSRFFFFSEHFVVGAERAFQSGKWVAYL